MQEKNTFLEMRNISKSFPGVQALDRVSFDLESGEVHALVGENGAGKSTLMKILSGVYEKDQGEILVENKVIEIDSPRHAQSIGISTVHQELNLFQNMSVSENIFSGNMPAVSLMRFENRKKAQEFSRDILERFELFVEPDTPLHKLSIAQQQVVEISRALVQETKVLILDEPTSSLTEKESQLLFKIINRLVEEGISIIYISHRLEEVFKIADRVTVLRDGTHVGTNELDQVTIEKVIHMMVGRDLEDMYGDSLVSPQNILLEVEGLTSESHFSDISFSLREGEILGLSGLVGAGRTDVGLALFGSVPLDSGKIQVLGEEVKINSPRQAMNKGIAYLSEDRQDDALFVNLDVKQNIAANHLERFTSVGLINKTSLIEEATNFVNKLQIHTPSIHQNISSLSGGNQQKVIIARWLAIKPRILIVDEPTRGIDVGVKVEIYSLLHQLAAEGVGIILISSELPEILGMSDRILVMHEGKMMGEIPAKEATEEIIMTMASGQKIDHRYSGAGQL